MPSKYLRIYKEALKAYEKQGSRPGYLFGYFSKLRHSKKEYLHIANLKKILESENDERALEEIKKYFINSKTKFNNHSFSMYFLDLLAETYPDEGFEVYYPKKRKLVFYQGQLYRGIRIDKKTLDNIFVNGHEERESSQWVDEYASDTSMSLGTSTSTDHSVAQGYATSVISRGIRESGQVIFRSGYLLKINYRAMALL